MPQSYFIMAISISEASMKIISAAPATASSEWDLKLKDTYLDDTIPNQCQTTKLFQPRFY